MANQRSVSQQSWSLWGVTSWARRRLRSSLTLLSFQGIGRSHLSICSRTRHRCRSVLKRVSPRRSWNSCSSLSPRRGARCEISPAWGIRCANRRSAHFLLKWPSKTFWVDSPQLFDARWLPVSPLDQFEVGNRSRNEAVQPSFSVHDLPSELPFSIGRGVRALP